MYFINSTSVVIFHLFCTLALKPPKDLHKIGFGFFFFLGPRKQSKFPLGLLPGIHPTQVTLGT